MRTLNFDLATTTGWAANLDDNTVVSGRQTFNLEKGVMRGIRYIMFRDWLEKKCDEIQPELISYEMPHLRGYAAVEICVGFVTRVLEIAALREIEVVPIHTGLLKSYTTGNGHASKNMMAESAAFYYPHYDAAKDSKDKDEADALALLRYTLDHFDPDTHAVLFGHIPAPDITVEKRIRIGGGVPHSAGGRRSKRKKNVIHKAQ